MSQNKTNSTTIGSNMNSTITSSLLGGGGGSYLTTTGVGAGLGITGANQLNFPWNGIINTTWDDKTDSYLHVKGDAEIEGDLKIKGKSLADAIDNIEKRLAILHPNKDLEERWEQLKALGEQYRELERDILEKEKIWETLKK
jgi:hypothetical protein